MLQKKTMMVILGGSALALAFAGGLAVGQAQTPTQSKGLSNIPLWSLDLSDEMDSVKGRPLRMRKVTLLPGGVIGLHTHKDRPAVSYLLQGEMVYHPQGKPEQVLKVGQGFAEGKDTTHWAENRGTVPAVWIAVDIPKEP